VGLEDGDQIDAYLEQVCPILRLFDRALTRLKRLVVGWRSLQLPRKSILYHLSRIFVVTFANPPLFLLHLIFYGVRGSDALFVSNKQLFGSFKAIVERSVPTLCYA
jgi:hypothetical protein